MKMQVITCVIGVLLLWGGSACSDPGNSPVLGKTSILRLDLGIAGGAVSGMDVTLANGLRSPGFSASPDGPANGMQHDALVPFFGDAEAASDKADSDGIGFPAGIEWSNLLGRKQGWEFAIDLGFVHHIPPEVEMTAAGRVVLNGPSEEALIRGEKYLGGQLGDFDYYPVLSFGLRYRF